MNKSKLCAVTLIILLLTIFFSGCVDENKNDNTIDGITLYVDINGSKQYTTIQKAVDDAKENYTIFVSPGLYKENFVINKTINLIGENPETTIIDGNKSGNVIVIDGAEFCNVTGFTIKNCGSSNAGMYIKTANNNISNNIFKDNHDGVYVHDSNANTNQNYFYDNTFTSNSGYGIYLSDSDSNMVKNNIFTDNSYGMRVKALNNIITGNCYKDNYRGLYFCCYADDNLVYNNNFINNSEYNAKDTSAGEIWYDSEKNLGNYWDDYVGTDDNGDGIGDLPYENITGYGANQDPYPLMDSQIC